MDINKNKKSILDLLDNVELELLHKDTDYAKQYLEEEGIDVAEEQEFVAQYMKKIQSMAKPIVNKERDKSLLEKALERVKEVITENVNQTNETLKALLRSKTPSVQYRKLENWTDNEIRDVLADLDLVEFLEELDNEVD